MFNKIITASSTFITAIVLMPAVALAHVIVQPAQVGIGEFQTFSVGVPNEKDSSVTSVKLELPAGLREVAPTVKPGWKITMDKTGQDDSAHVTAITWSGGSIPAEQRDDFTFSAQVPAKASELHWKAFQTYADGTTVSWDQKPAGSDDATGSSGPYSVTKVVNDLAPATPKSATDSTSTLALAVAGFALVTSLAAVLVPRAKS